MPDFILSLAAQVVSAHVAKNPVSPEDLPQLIKDVHRALANAGQSTVEPLRGEPGRTCCCNQEIRHRGAPCLPRVWKTFLDAEAAPHH